MSRHRLRTINTARKAKAMQRSLEMMTEVAAGKTQQQIADEHGISRRAVRNVLARVDGAIAEMAQEDLDLISDLMNEADSHRTDGKLPATWFDRIHGLLETRIKLRGTAAPSKHLHATVPTDDDRRSWFRFKKAIFDLSDEQIDEVLAFAEAMPRIDTSKMSQEEFIRKYHPHLLKGETL